MHRPCESVVACVAMALVACVSEKPVQCKITADCNLHAGGTCDLYAPTGNMWCTYPDGDCSSGRRWSDFNTGDGLSGVCQDEQTGADAGVDASMPVDAGMDAGVDAAPDAGPDGGLPPDGGNGSVGDIALRFGGSGNDSGAAIAVGSDGSIYVAGHFPASINFGGGALTSAGNDDIFVARLTSEGQHDWSRRFGSSGHDRALGLALDAAGDVFVVGSFSGTVDFGGGNRTSAGGSDAFVLKLDGESGDHVWSIRFGADGDDAATDVAVNATGDIAVTGRFRNTVNFGGNDIPSKGGQDVFVAMFRGDNGNHLWSRGMGGSSTDDPGGVVFSGADVLVTGRYYGTGDFGGNLLMSDSTSWDVYIARYSGTNGNHIWSHRHGGSGADRAYAIVAHGSAFFITGEFLGTASFGDSALMSAGSYDGFIAKYDAATGSHLWSDRFGGTSNAPGRELAVTSVGNVIVGATFSGTTRIADRDLVSAGGVDIAIAEYGGANGAPQWALSFGGSGAEFVGGIVYRSDALHVTGRFAGSVNFFGTVLTALDQQDVFVVRRSF